MACKFNSERSNAPFLSSVGTSIHLQCLTICMYIDTHMFVGVCRGELCLCVYMG